MTEHPDVWGPHFWFVLHSIAYHYPEHPTKVTKRKYYDFIQNLPLFLPDPNMGDRFSALLDQHPVSPYLDCRESFILWMHRIHNLINRRLGKAEVSVYDGLDHYYQEFLENRAATADPGAIERSMRRRILVLAILIGLSVFIYMHI